MRRFHQLKVLKVNLNHSTTPPQLLTKEFQSCKELAPGLAFSHSNSSILDFRRQRQRRQIEKKIEDFQDFHCCSVGKNW